MSSYKNVGKVNPAKSDEAKSGPVNDQNGEIHGNESKRLQNHNYEANGLSHSSETVSDCDNDNQERRKSPDNLEESTLAKLESMSIRIPRVSLSESSSGYNNYSDDTNRKFKNLNIQEEMMCQENSSSKKQDYKLDGEEDLVEITGAFLESTKSKFVL